MIFFKLVTMLNIFHVSAFSIFGNNFNHLNVQKLKSTYGDNEDYSIIYSDNDKIQKYDNNSNIILPNLDILFYGQVTDESCMKLTQALLTLDNMSKKNSIKYSLDVPQPISLHIQSYGGMLMPTFYVCDVIKNLDTMVNTYIDGYAASAATIISVCGNKRYTTRFSNMLIHQLSTEHRGTYNQLSDGMTNSNLFMENIRKIYLENSKLDEEKLNELLSKDIWLNSDLCLEFGLVDKIL